jgi:hypothetical protein
MASMILALIIAVPLIGAVVYACWLASELGVATTWPRRTGRTSRLDPDHAGEAASGHGGP